MTDTPAVDNVILFPVVKRGSPPQTLDDIRDSVAEVRKEHTTNILGNFLPEMYSNLMELSGSDVFKTEFAKDVTLVNEAVKSLIMKCNGQPYPLQALADKMYEITGEMDDDTGMFMAKFRYDRILVTEDVE